MTAPSRTTASPATQTPSTPGGLCFGILVGRRVDVPLVVEQDEVGAQAGLDQAPVREAESAGGTGGQAGDRLLDRDQALPDREAAEKPRSGAVETRVRARRRRSRPSRRAAAGVRRSCAPPRRWRNEGSSAPPDRSRAGGRRPRRPGRRPRSASVAPSTTIRSGPSVPSTFSQPGRPSRMSRAIARRASGSRRPLERRRGPARLRPRRQQAREQRRTRAVGVLVERDVDLRGGASISSSSGSTSASPDRDLRCERCSGAPERREHVDHLPDRLE